MNTFNLLLEPEPVKELKISALEQLRQKQMELNNMVSNVRETGQIHGERVIQFNLGDNKFTGYLRKRNKDMVINASPLLDAAIVFRVLKDEDAVKILD